VELIDKHGVDVILDTVSRLSEDAGADITVSTAHKAKGREWSSVRIAEDVTEPEDPENVDAAGEPPTSQDRRGRSPPRLRRRHPSTAPSRPRWTLLDQPAPRRQPQPHPSA
jgi:hypothetical protein